MKKNKPKYLKLYKEWAITLKLPENGLCNCFNKSFPERNKLFELIKPMLRDLNQLQRDNCSTIYWGSESMYTEAFIFTPLRQNLVLLMAAMNNEL